ncbi:hypothetical protein SEUCBS139899_010286 [Sporothrix eucalyptigena]|uniref:Nudix hydrolase domain-containing protein n=1 Tax=Sporothrix eucalyptigena TaxID=1812306 RepID=A0ABP0CTI4_9PEZI
MPADKKKTPPKTPSVPAPSASVVIISPQNEILLLHRRKTGTFSSAHVFPGGNLSTFHEGSSIPAVDSSERHIDGPSYRIAAIRETFEESGILLARPASANASTSSPFSDRKLLQVPNKTTQPARVDIANDKVRFEDWLSCVGGVPDNENLIPFTRWLTPPNMARRYTTQMYLYFLPLDTGAETAKSGDVSTPKTNNGASADQTEVTEAEFATAATWVQRARNSDIILFPPQLYILSLLAPLLKGTDYAAERQAVASLVHGGPAPGEDPSTFVPWADRVISPRLVGKLPDDKDGRAVMLLDYPGPELKNAGRAGDLYRAVVVGNMPPGPPRDLELVLRADVLPRVQAKPKVQATGATGKL